MDRKNTFDQSPSVSSSPQATLFTPVVRGSPRGKVTPSQLRFSPARRGGRVYLTTPRLKAEVPGSVECTPEVLRQLVSPPPGFDSCDFSDSADDPHFSATRRLDYLQQITEAPESLLSALQHHLSLHSYLTPASTVRVLMESLGAQESGDCKESAVAVQTDMGDKEEWRVEIRVREDDLAALRTHINEISCRHTEELAKTHADYREKVQSLESALRETRKELGTQVEHWKRKLRNAAFLLKSSGLEGVVTTGLEATECVECRALREQVAGLNDKLRLSQDYIRKASAMNSVPGLFAQKGKELRVSIHKQVVLIEKLFATPESSISSIETEFLRLPYLLKPLFDLLKDYEKLATSRGTPLQTVDENALVST